MSDTVEQIKSALNIVEVVSPYVKLTKAGKYYRGLSPFNKEKTPSFFVTPDRGLYHCFSSGKGGDMFTFIQEMEGVDFKGALKILAEKAGVPLSYEKPESRDRKERLYALMEEANAFFQKTLKEKPDARAYLLKRALAEETLERFQVGYAPNDWRAASVALEAAGYAASELIEAGLTKRPEGEGVGTRSPYDRFRGRIMFPIRDVSGRTIGFSGRVFEDDSAHPGAKYLNSPETSIFNKSRILFGVDSAKEGIRKYGFSILVEGQFDLLLAHQAGYVNTLALSGTSFTAEHAALLLRYSPNMVIAFDSDRAGVSAAGRAAAIALEKGLNVKVASLPPGEDPADLIGRDVAAWKEAIKSAAHVVDFYLAHLSDLGYDERRFKLEVSRTVLPFVAAIENEIDRAHFIHRVAEAVGASDSAVAEEVKKLRTGAVSSAAPAGDTAPAAAFESRGEMVERLLIGLSRALRESDAPTLADDIGRALSEVTGEDRIQEIVNSTSDMRRAIVEADLFLERHAGEKGLKEGIDELVSILRKEAAREEYRKNMALLRRAEKEGKKEEVDVLLKAIAGLAREF